MAHLTVEERLTTLEAEMAALKKSLTAQTPKDGIPWWEKRFGAFKDDPMYDEAMRLGREWREAQRPDYDADEEAA